MADLLVSESKHNHAAHTMRGRLVGIISHLMRHLVAHNPHHHHHDHSHAQHGESSRSGDGEVSNHSHHGHHRIQR